MAGWSGSAGTGQGCHTSAPAPQGTDRQTGTTEDRRPHGRTPVIASGARTRRPGSAHPIHRVRLLPNAPSRCRPSRVLAILPAAGGHTHRRRAPARRSGREEARVLQVHTNGAQRASSHRSVRLVGAPDPRTHHRRRRSLRQPDPRQRSRRQGRRGRRPGRVEHRANTSGARRSTRPSLGATAHWSSRSTAPRPRGPG